MKMTKNIIWVLKFITVSIKCAMHLETKFSYAKVRKQVSLLSTQEVRRTFFHFFFEKIR